MVRTRIEQRDTPVGGEKEKERERKRATHLVSLCKHTYNRLYMNLRMRDSNAYMHTDIQYLIQDT